MLLRRILRFGLSETETVHCGESQNTKIVIYLRETDELPYTVVTQDASNIRRDEAALPAALYETLRRSDGYSRKSHEMIKTILLVTRIGAGYEYIGINCYPHDCYDLFCRLKPTTSGIILSTPFHLNRVLEVGFRQVHAKLI